jgi:hypothetical protein
MGSMSVPRSRKVIAEKSRSTGPLAPELAFRGQSLCPQTMPMYSRIQEHAEEWKL